MLPSSARSTRWLLVGLLTSTGTVVTARAQLQGSKLDGGPGSGGRDGAVVRVEGGLLRGLNGTGGGRPVLSFLSVPYAQPPVAALRFRAPRAAAPWSGIRAVTSFPMACIQKPRPAGNNTAAQQRMAEDCLYLNVYVASEAAWTM